MTNFTWDGIEYVSMDDIGNHVMELVLKGYKAHTYAFVAAYAVWIALNKPEYGMDAVRIAYENIESWVLRLEDGTSYTWYRNDFLLAWRVTELMKEN